MAFIDELRERVASASKGSIVILEYKNKRTDALIACSHCKKQWWVYGERLTKGSGRRGREKYT